MVVYGLGHAAAEDFKEIIFACAYGFGLAGTKLLRGMFERAVTALHIARHPEKAQDFADYYSIERFKFWSRMKELYGDRFPVSDAELEKRRAQRDAVIDSFRPTPCQKCGDNLCPDCRREARGRTAWTRLSLDAMAREAGSLDEFYTFYYLNPTLQLHSTMSSVVARTRKADGDHVVFRTEGGDEMATHTPMFAHHLAILVCDTQNDHFHYGLKDELRKRLAAWFRVWGKLSNQEIWERINSPAV